jgi:inactivated superfamily I helicase
MIDRLASLTALGPGLGGHTDSPTDIQEFAERRVNHLKEKVAAGDLDPAKLQERLIARFGDEAGNVVDESGNIDFEKLQSLIASQQTSKLQQRLESWLGEDARGIVSEDGRIDSARFASLDAVQDADRLQARLTDRFGPEADGVISSDGMVDVGALRSLFIAREQDQPYEPGRHDWRGPAGPGGHPFLDFLT